MFIVGLSRDLLDKMIELKLEKAGLKGIQADEYVRKIIQIEINIQDWIRYIAKVLREAKI